MKRNKAFTLIELVSVLVILAILALIVTPLVLNIIKKARTAADKRSIDAYGRSIELAIADYLLDTGNFPTSIEELTIEYSGDTVSCSTIQLNSDSSIYLAGCTVDRRQVTGYTYGKEEVITYKSYNIGDLIEYKGINFYVIEDSDTTTETVTLLKAEPLTVEEIDLLLPSTEVENKVDKSETYAKMPYYSSENCVSAGDMSGCSTEYIISDIKQVIDIWLKSVFKNNEEVYSRLITKTEIDNNFEFEDKTMPWGETRKVISSKYSYMFNSDYSYWTMTSHSDFKTDVFVVDGDGYVGNIRVNYEQITIRPVIIVKKMTLSS